MRDYAQRAAGKVTGASKELLAVVALHGRTSASEFLSVTAIYVKYIRRKESLYRFLCTDQTTEFAITTFLLQRVAAMKMRIYKRSAKRVTREKQRKKLAGVGGSQNLTPFSIYTAS
jgi:hypothetical protein